MSHTMVSVVCVDPPKYDGINPEGSSYMHFMLPRGAVPILALSSILFMAKPRDSFIGHIVESFK